MNLFRRTSRKWRGVDFMTLVPVQACGWQPGQKPDQVVVLQPRFQAGFLSRFLQPRLKESKKFLRVPLEERGSYLWNLMDGHKTVGELTEAFHGEFRDENDQVPQRVATFLYQMVDNKLIEFSNFKI
jgi:hypothetical protein